MLAAHSASAAAEGAVTGLTNPLNGFALADAALGVIVYDMGAFGTMLNNMGETDRNEMRAGIAQAIERAALAAAPGGERK